MRLTASNIITLYRPTVCPLPVSLLCSALLAASFISCGNTKPADRTQAPPTNQPTKVPADAFASLSPEEHLARAEALLKAAADQGSWSDSDRDQYIANLHAIPKGSPLRTSPRAHRLVAAMAKFSADVKARQLAEKRQADQAALAEAENEKRLAEADRVALAKRLESGFLDASMDVTVRATGQHHTTLLVTWVLVDRVTAHQLAKESSVFAGARAVGFKRLEISDGYGSAWFWNLD